MYIDVLWCIKLIILLGSCLDVMTVFISFIIITEKGVVFFYLEKLFIAIPRVYYCHLYDKHKHAFQFIFLRRYLFRSICRYKTLVKRKNVVILSYFFCYISLSSGILSAVCMHKGSRRMMKCIKIVKIIHRTSEG